MMDDFEHGLATALRAAVPAPPTEIDPAEITRTGGPGRLSRWAAPVLAAAAVAAVAVAALMFTHSTGGQPPQAASPPSGRLVSRQPADLLGSWQLTDLEGFDGAAHTAPDVGLTFRFYPDGGVADGCDASQVVVTVGSLRFVQGWVGGTIMNCPDLGLQQSRFLYGQVLTGTANWQIRDDQLTVHNGRAAAVFQRIGGLSAAQRTLAIHVARTAARLAPPPGASTAPATGHPGWPANVSEVSAIATTHADAMHYVGAAGSDTTPVLVIRLVGDFSWNTTGPPGHGPITGNVITIVINAQTGKTTDSGIEQQNPPRSLTNATILYAR